MTWGLVAGRTLSPTAIDFGRGRAYTSKSHMRASALLVVLLSVRISAAEATAKPDAQLLLLEAELTQKLEERKSGAVPPDQYRLFAEKFRVDLDAALGRAPKTPLNTGRHAMILARLDESGPGQAIARLDRALGTDSGSAELLLAKGSIQLQQGDYAGALAAADEVLKGNAERGEAPDPAAVSLRQFSKGRGTPTGQKPTAAPAPPVPGAAAPDSSGRQSIQFTPREARARVEVPSVSGDSGQRASAVESGPSTVSKALGWSSRQIERGQNWGVGLIDSTLGLSPEERKIAVKGAQNGAVLVGAIGGTAATVSAIGYCAPSVPTGAPYAGCVLASGGGGLIAGGFLGGYAAGALFVLYDRAQNYYNENAPFGSAQSSSQAE